MGDRRTTEPLKRAAATALGVVVGLALLEAMVRPLASVQLPPPPDIAHDVLAGPLIESRQIEEGIQASHFTRGGSRWTGTTPPAAAPVIVIIGDSYVVARQVADDETMGAWVERLSRNDGTATAARQYGWNGARPAQYVHVARDVLDRWSPARVVVVLAENDFDARALTDTIIPPPARSGVHERSSLVMLIRHRAALLGFRAQHTLDRWEARLGLRPTPRTNGASVAVDAATTEDPSAANPAEPTPPSAGMEAAVVSALSRAYGSRLAIVYAANTRIRDGREASENHLELACAVQHVQCISTRQAMRALEQRGLVTRGFSTTKLGSGHLNADGHEMMGRLIWSMTRNATGRAR